MEWAGKTVSVVGLGKSNLALAAYLIRQGARVIARDRLTEDALGQRFTTLAQFGADFQLGPDYLKGLVLSDVIFLAPGMPKNTPEIVEAQQLGVPISTEINLFFDKCAAPIIGITGSSGKTTTTTLIGAILEAAGHEVYVGGNIGRPLIDMVDDIPADAWVVLELSSFQLELLRVSPTIAVMTNISPNHLDVHGTMDAYVSAKRHIYSHQGEADLFVANFDDRVVRALAAAAPAAVSWFSRHSEPPEGAAVLEGRIALGCFEVGTRTLVDVCGVDDLRLIGEHNVGNVLAAAAVTHALGVEPGTIREVVTSFTGVAHRLELVRESEGVKFYNDSIATSPDRAMAGIQSFSEPVHLIAGGYDKKLPFDQLAQVIVERTRSVHLIGQTADEMARAIRRAVADSGVKSPPVIIHESLEAAVAGAFRRSEQGDVVLMSPACASFGMFSDFEARGERFRKIVGELTETVQTKP